MGQHTRYGWKWPFLAKKHHTIKKNIHNSAKKYDILLKQKGFESLGSFISEKKKVFVLGVGHGDPSFAQVGPKKYFLEVFAKNFRTTGFQLVFNINWIP